MFCYRECPREGNIPAPPEFIEHLRDDTGCPDLTCWWDPVVTRTVYFADGEKEHRPGAWVVWCKQRVVGQFSVHGVEVQHMHDTWFDVYKLDGEFGCPTGLGRWVGECLNQADNTKRGPDVRGKELNELQERKYLKPLEDNRTFNEEFYRDRFTRKVFQMHADKVGVPTRIKEDVDKIFKEAVRSQNAMWEDNYKAAKEYRVYSEARPR